MQNGYDLYPSKYNFEYFTRLQSLICTLILDSASTVRVETGSTSHLRMAAMLNDPTGGAKTIDL